MTHEIDHSHYMRRDSARTAIIVALLFGLVIGAFVGCFLALHLGKFEHETVKDEPAAIELRELLRERKQQEVNCAGLPPVKDHSIRHGDPLAPFIAPGPLPP